MSGLDRVLSQLVTRIGRRIARDPQIDTKKKDSGYDGWKPMTATVDEANLVSSQIAHDPMMHAPAIDLDVPCYLVASSTPGHFHLYIEQTMSWEKYQRLLKVMVEVGLVEEGFYNASVKRGASYLRLPHVKKVKP